jgi:hypothetical protein
LGRPFVVPCGLPNCCMPKASRHNASCEKLEGDENKDDIVETLMPSANYWLALSNPRSLCQRRLFFLQLSELECDAVTFALSTPSFDIPLAFYLACYPSNNII